MREAHITVDNIFSLSNAHIQAGVISGSRFSSSRNDEKHVWIVKTMSFKWQRAHFKMGISLAFKSMYAFCFAVFFPHKQNQNEC